MLLSRSFSMFLLIIFLCSSCGNKNGTNKKLLVFSKTEGFRHASIEAGIKTIKLLGKENGFDVDATEDASQFNFENLSKYAAVVFLNTTGDVLNSEQESAFKQYIQSGTGFVGIHAATDTEYDWPWYNKLVGAYFNGHPAIQEATMQVINKEHPSTLDFETNWVKTEEWYNFKDIHSEINVLIVVDESTYEGGTNENQHPISWYHNYDGGRAFYTAMGHATETFQEPKFKKHLLGGILSVIE